MNREKEYERLLKELENTPIELEYTIQRVEGKLKGRKVRKYWAIPASSIGILFTVFVLLVNTVPTFAYTCGQIPGLKELAKALVFSPSLSAAVENQYVQPINEQQKMNDITAKIEYLIVDQKQLNIVYRIASDRYELMDVNASIHSTTRESLDGYGLSSGNNNLESGALNHLTIDFIDGKMPSSLYLTLQIQDKGTKTQDTVLVEENDKINIKDDMLKPSVEVEPHYVGEFTFKLVFDPYFTAQGNTIKIEQSFSIDEQILILDEVAIYPTHMNILLDDQEENSAWLKKLDFYIENEKGERFERITNGISASGKVDSPMMAAHRLESAFFSQSKELTMYIIGSEWLEKDKQFVKLNLETLKDNQLPSHIQLEQASKREHGWVLNFTAPLEEESTYQLWDSCYYDEQGNKYDINSWSTGTGSIYDEGEGTYREIPGRFYETIPLEGYKYNTVYMTPIFTKRVELVTPIVIKIK